MPQPPVTISPTLYMEDDSQWLIENLQPIPQANHIRQQILDFLNQLIRPKMPTEEVQLLICGSTCSRTYLPDSDIDLTLITPNSSGLDSSHSSTSSSSSGGNHNNHMKYLIDLSTTFIEEIYRRDRDRDAHNETSWKLSSASGESIEQDFPIRNVEFINARVKLLHCVVRNVGIDITVNQRGAIGSLLFIEEADKVVGCDHLLKKSIVLIKAWCLYESVSICGVPIIGAKDGMFSSYALTIMVLHLFNRYGNSLRSPFAVLRMFFYFYHGFPWETSVLTLEGPKPIQSGGSSTNLPKELQGKYQLCNNQFKHITSTQRFQKLKQQHSKEVPSSSGATSAAQLTPLTQQGVSRFPIRACNIQDPVDESNNLGVSVSRNNLQIVDKALYFGYNRMEHIVSVMSQLLSMYHSSGSTSGSTANTTSNPNVINSMTTNNSDVGSMSMQNNYLQTSVASGRSSPSSSATPTDPQRRGSRRGSQGGLPPPPYVFPAVGGVATQIFPSVTGSETSLIGSSQTMDPPTTVGIPPPPPPISTPSTSSSTHFSAFHHSYSSNVTTATPSTIPVPRGLFVRELFPVSMVKYIMTAPGMQRPDLLLHPLQKAPAGSTKSHYDSQKSVYPNQQQSSNVDDTSNTSMDPFQSNIEEVVDALIAPKPSVLPARSEFTGDLVEENKNSKNFGATHGNQNCSDDLIRKEDKASGNKSEEALEEILDNKNNVPDGDQQLKVDQTSSSTLTASISSGFNAITSKSKKRKDREKEKAKERFSRKNEFIAVPEVFPQINEEKRNPEGSEENERDQCEQSDGSNSSSNGSKHHNADRIVLSAKESYHKESVGLQKPRSVLKWSILLLISMGAVFIAISFTAPVDGDDSSMLTRIQLNGQYYWYSYLKGVCGNGSGTGYSREKVSYEGVRSVSVVTPSTAPTQQSCGENASRFDSLTHLITHWVQLGDTVTFGDFSAPSTATSNSLAASFGKDQSTVFVWQKDFQYLTTTQVPYFTIVDSRFEDAGHYRCLKMIGSTSFLVTETIVRISRKPTVNTTPFFRELRQGSSFRFELDFEGFPKPMFQWYKNGYKMEGQNTNTLQLVEVDPSHTGTYSCELTNIAGSILWLEGSLLVSEQS